MVAIDLTKWTPPDIVTVGDDAFGKGRSRGERMRRIGVLMHTGADEPEAQACFAAFMQGLQEIRLGRWAQYADRLSLERGDAARLRKHATELVALGPEVPCATGCPPY